MSSCTCPRFVCVLEQVIELLSPEQIKITASQLTDVVQLIHVEEMIEDEEKEVERQEKETKRQSVNSERI